MKKLKRNLSLPVSLDDVLPSGAVEWERQEYIFNLYEK